MQGKTPSNLLELDSALGTYLDEMLFQATEVARPPRQAPVLTPLREDGLLLPETLVTDEETPAREAEAENVIETAAAEPVTEPVESVQAKSDESDQAGAEAEAQLSADMFPLQCLMFSVSGTLLSIPLVELSGIVEWSDQLTRLPGEPDWVLGVLKYRDQNIRIIDSARVLQIKSGEATTHSHVLVLGEAGWGITCDKLDRVVTLQQDDIKWQQARGRMAYGTVRKTLSSLLNPKGIVKNLQTGL